VADLHTEFELMLGRVTRRPSHKYLLRDRKEWMGVSQFRLLRRQGYHPHEQHHNLFTDDRHRRTGSPALTYLMFDRPVRGMQAHINWPGVWCSANVAAPRVQCDNET
jgi:hypothetical protein